jgi:plasmid stabilization system protein ParE
LRGLGKDFIAKVRQVIKRFTGNPEFYPKVYRETRQSIVERFPYSVLYQEDSQEIIVIGVFHSSRNPDVWMKRVKP